MMVSLVIPTYYRPDDLLELFNSILKQTFMPAEVIVVDDTPSNVIKALCKRYEALFERARSKLIYVRNPGERSSAASRNLGARLAKGELIMFLDSDVVLYDDYVERILEVFKTRPNALGVQGWITNLKRRGGKLHFLYNFFKKMFFLSHYAIDSCRYSEYPITLTKVINCEGLSGSNMTLKRKVFNEFKFDERLKKYSYMEDLLLSHSIFQKYPSSLFITPYAKCIHKHSMAGRVEAEELKGQKAQYRKYVLVKLFGLKGLYIYFMQSFGSTLINLAKGLLKYARR